MLYKLQMNALIRFTKKERAIIRNYRPTLIVDGQMAISNISQITPEPLEPGVEGTAVFVVGWEGPLPSPFEPGTSFGILEGPNKVGEGKVLDVEVVGQFEL